jgi:Asp-tRNA(Asn)/Glu-tRNA(Gln) amidotransferase A subunit family amidase
MARVLEVPALDAYGAFVERVSEAEAAAAADRALADLYYTSPANLAGVRVAVKDNIPVKGLKWTAGLPLFAERRGEEDALAVKMLKWAGARVIGVTATDSAGFGMMTPGVVNPRWPELTAGGSSGGSAAAVAAGLADVAIGTDTGGSVRVPAACCGVYGLKVSFAESCLDDVTPLAPSFDTAGLIAADIDVLIAAARPFLAMPAPEEDERLRTIGYDARRLGEVAPEVGDVVRAEVERLRGLGHRVVEIELPDRSMLSDAHGVLACVEARDEWADHWPAQAELFTRTAARTLAHAAQIDAASEAWAREVIELARCSIEVLFKAVEMLIGPVMMCPPVRVGARHVTVNGEEMPVLRAFVSETCPFNVSGHPALSIPIGGPEQAWPRSVQLVGRETCDVELLAFAKRWFPS